MTESYLINPDAERELPEDAETAEKTASHGETEQRRHDREDACDQRPAKPAASDQHESRANTNRRVSGFVLARDSC